MLKGEIKLAKHGSLILTNKRLVDKEITILEKTTKEIPLNKINSILSYNKRFLWLLIGASISLLLGVILIIMGKDFSSTGLSYLGYFLIFLFLLFSTLFIILKTEGIEFASNTAKIFTDEKGYKKFADKVREGMYND